jgi:DNA-binding transcriptional LysR family regulator
MPYIHRMNGVHLGSVDLNLIVALDALLAERSVTRAAARVGITQSAMSHALARLRSLTGDELLARGRDGMVPTLRAEALAAPVRRGLDEIARALAPPEAFDPATAKRRIVVGTTDYGELVLLPRVVARLAKEAPGIDLRVLTLPRELSETLMTGTVDLAITPLRPADERPDIYGRRLFDDRFVCVVRKHHPLVGKKLTLARFAAASHALIAPRGTEGGVVDDALARLGLRRRVAVAVPHFLIAPHLVANTDLILTLAGRVADVLARPLGLSVLTPPPELRLEGFTMSAVWHERTHDDAAQRWLRGIVEAEASVI